MSSIHFLPASRMKGRPVPANCFVVPDKFIPAILDKSPIQILYGSRFSGKSYTKAYEFLARAAGKQYFRGIYARQKQTDVKNSQYQLFKDTIDKYPWLRRQFVCRDSDYEIHNLITGHKLIPGSFDNPQKIMSTADPTDIWVEEPITHKGQINKTDFLSMYGSLRNPYGIPPRFHFTFNPISIDTWIYDEFFKKKTIPCNAVQINYNDNPFCPESAFEFFAWLKDVDYDRWEIDALGKWGIPKPDRPYFHRLLRNMKAYFGPTEYNPFEPVYISLDFNVVNSWTFRQKSPTGGPRWIEEIHNADLDLEDICKDVARRYGGNQLYFTGDGSGNNASAYTKGNQSAWELVRTYMSRYGADYCNYEAVPLSNISTESSCFVSNALIAHYENDFIIDDVKCPKLTADIRRMRRTADGSLDKKDCNKYDYGHLGDCFRYDLCNFEYHTFKAISRNHSNYNN